MQLKYLIFYLIPVVTTILLSLLPEETEASCGVFGCPDLADDLDDGEMPQMRINPLTALAAIPAFIWTANAASRMMQSSSAAMLGATAAANIQKKMDSEAARQVYKAVLDSILDRMLASQQIQSKNFLRLRNGRSHFVSAQGVGKLDVSQVMANLEDASMPASARFLQRLNG